MSWRRIGDVEKRRPVPLHEPPYLVSMTVSEISVRRRRNGREVTRALRAKPLRDVVVEICFVEKLNKLRSTPDGGMVLFNQNFVIAQWLE